MAETIPGFDIPLWNGLLAPAGTPAPVIARLAAETQAALRSQALQAKLAEQGSEAAPNTPEAFARFIQAEIPKWREIVRISGAIAD